MGHDWTRLLVIAGVSSAGAAALLPVLRRQAVRLDITDRPRPGRAHTSPTPYLGGVAIAVVTVAASLLVPGGGTERAVVLAAALAVAALGLADDMWDLRPARRVPVEAAAAAAVFAAGVRAELLGGPGDALPTVAWLVLLANAFNLLDNMDGCAGLVGAITASALAVAAGLQGQLVVGGLAAALAGSSAAFLFFNWPPARIFMGDAGSLFVGFVVATITLSLQFPGPQTHQIPAVLLLAGPALFDTTLVVLSRLLAGRPIWVGATDHTSHRLRRLGLSVAAVASLVGCATAACATLGVLVGRGVLTPLPVLVISVALAATAMIAFLRMPAYAEHGPMSL